MQRISEGSSSRIMFVLCVLLFTCDIFLGSCIKRPLQNRSIITNSEYSPEPIVADVIPKIYIDGMDSSQDWDNCPWVNGSGSFIDPYIIRDISINGSKTGSCIIINNTEQYFRIENCSLFNAGYSIYDAGIRLLNASNGLLHNNNCSTNRYNGILLSSSCKNNTISDNNCTRNYNYGISLYSSSNNTLYGNNCSENFNHGIYLYWSSNNTVEGNNCSGNVDGLYLTSSSNNTLKENILSRNYQWGIDLAGGSNNTLLDNILEQNGVFFWGSVIDAKTTSIDTSNLVNGKPVQFFANKTEISIPAGAGEVLLSFCNDTIIQDFSSSGVLIAFYSCFNNTIRRNNCSGYVNGIELWESSNNTIANNTCFGNNQDGIYLYNSLNNTLSGNNCSGNLFAGIHLQSNLNTLERNNCSGNFFYGIYLEVSNNCSIRKNTCRENNIGIIVDSTDYCTFDENTCQLNRYRGIYFSYSCNNTLTNNFCSANEDGIYLGLTSHNNTLNGNNCSANMEHGIYLFSSNNNTIRGNNCSRNQGHGIYLSNSNFTEVFQNLVKKNWQGHITEISCSGNHIYDNDIILFPLISIFPTVTYTVPAPFTIMLLSASAGQSIGFRSDLTGGSPPFMYQWNFGDDTENLTDTNPTHKFATAGQYTITCTVIDADGDVSVDKITISIWRSNDLDWIFFVLILLIAVGIVAIVWFIKKRKEKTTQG